VLQECSSGNIIEQTSFFDTAQLALIVVLGGYAPSICVAHQRQHAGQIQAMLFGIGRLFREIQREPGRSQENMESRLADFYQSIRAHCATLSSADAPSQSDTGPAPQSS